MPCIVNDGETPGLRVPQGAKSRLRIKHTMIPAWSVFDKKTYDALPPQAPIGLLYQQPDQDAFITKKYLKFGTEWLESIDEYHLRRKTDFQPWHAE